MKVFNVALFIPAAPLVAPLGGNSESEDELVLPLFPPVADLAGAPAVREI